MDEVTDGNGKVLQANAHRPFPPDVENSILSNVGRIYGFK
jgi:hypothetical protein